MEALTMTINHNDRRAALAENRATYLRQALNLISASRGWTFGSVDEDPDEFDLCDDDDDIDYGIAWGDDDDDEDPAATNLLLAAARDHFATSIEYRDALRNYDEDEEQRLEDDADAYEGYVLTYLS